MTDYSPASRNQSDNGTMAGMLRIVLGKFLQHVDDMLPAQVIAYDAGTNRAQVQPLIVVVTTENVVVNRAQVASVPVAQWGAGGFVLRFPVKTGDLGWIKASDRDISLFKQTYQSSAPNTQRKHSFEDAVFFPDTFMKGVTINSEDESNAVLQNFDGSVRIALWPDKVKITAPSILFDTPTATFTGDVTIDGTINVQNSESSSTPCQINGNVIATGDITAGSISLESHVHGGVTTGGGDTGVPV